jgi:hypothetical protein
MILRISESFIFVFGVTHSLGRTRSTHRAGDSDSDSESDVTPWTAEVLGSVPSDDRVDD